MDGQMGGGRERWMDRVRNEGGRDGGMKHWVLGCTEWEIIHG